MHFLYLIENLLNGKVYVGQTNNPSLRWSQHKSNAKRHREKQVVSRAISKYGAGNFSFQVIACCQDQLSADASEEEVIAQYDSRNPEKGYNIDLGGNSSPRTLVVCQKISNSLKSYYRKNFSPMKGKSLPEEWRKNISKASLGKAGANNGKEFDPGWKLKMSQAKIGKEIKEKRKFPEEKEREICKLYLEGASMYALGKKFQCFTSLIQDILARNNIQQRKSNYRGHSNGKNIFSQEQEGDIVATFLKGDISISELSKKYGCAKTTVRDILVRNNIKL